jgi:mono/diheme cytochrome c family protein
MAQINAAQAATLARRAPEGGVVAAGHGGTADAGGEPGVVDGKEVYTRVCAACHQASGDGLAGVFPPLAGAGGYYGDAQNMAKIIVHGLNGEIVVKGQTYNGVMPAQGVLLSDEEIAAVATFVRTNFGNDDGPVTVADVAAVR